MIGRNKKTVLGEKPKKTTSVEMRHWRFAAHLVECWNNATVSMHYVHGRLVNVSVSVKITSHYPTSLLYLPRYNKKYTTGSTTMRLYFEDII